MSEIIYKPRGTIDYLGTNKILLDSVCNFLDNYSFKYGAKKIDTPMFEDGKLFVRGVGESTDIVTKEMFRLDVKGEHDYILRPEFTASINRAIVENKLYASPDLPLKFCYHGPVFRFERPQSGRYRQFNQFGVEFIDAKIDLQTQLDAILLFYNAASDLLGHKLLLKINYLGDFKTREAYKTALKEYYADKIDTMCDDCKNRFVTNPLRILDCKVEQDIEINKGAPSLGSFIVGEEKEKFDNICSVLTALNIPFEIDNKLVRGLDYYTGVVFELYDPSAISLGAIGGGGQYDKLMKEISGIEDEGLGFSYGVERLLLSLTDERKNDLIKDALPQLDFFTIDLRQQKDIFPIVVGDLLRKNGYKVSSSSYSKALNGSLKMSNRENAKYSLIYDDYNPSKVIVKNMMERSQEIIEYTSEAELVKTIINLVKGE